MSGNYQPTRSFGAASRSRGFTVIELLIVVSIIVVLAVMLVMVWPMVQERLLRLHCQTNLSKCHKVMCEYGANNNGFLPPVTGSGSNGWSYFDKGGKGSMNGVVVELKGYGGSADIFSCPAWPEYDDPDNSCRQQWENPTGRVNVTGYNLFIGFWPWGRQPDGSDRNTECSQYGPWLLPDARKRAFRIDSPDNPPIMCDEMTLGSYAGGFYHHPRRDDVVTSTNSSRVREPGGGGHTLFLSGAVDWFGWEELLAESQATDHTPAIPFYPYDGFSRFGYAGWKPRDDQVSEED